MTKPTRPTFVLTLVPSHQHDDPEGFRRLRFILKRLLRGFGFRCTKIDYPDSAHQPPGLPPQNESTNAEQFEPSDG